MKVLFLFLDMIRVEQLAIANEKIHEYNPLNEKLKNIGGTLYPNCYTPAPDTTRSMASLWSGLPPKENECNTRLKWAKHFLPGNIDTVFDEFINNNYQINIFHEPEERKVGLFPSKIYDYAKFNDDYDLEKFLKNINIEENSLTYLGISDFHLAYNDSGYSNEGAKQSFKLVTKAVDLVFDQLNQDDFDHIFIFSDHGFAFADEVLSPHNYVSNIRSNILMIHRVKNQNTLNKNNKLCSIMSILPTIEELFNVEKNRYDFSLFNEKEREYYTIIDHFNYQPQLNHNIDLWGLIYKNVIYSRTVEEGYLLNSKDFKDCKVGIIDDYDEILNCETDFAQYEKEYKVFVEHKKWMKKEHDGTISYLSTNIKRRKTTNILKKILLKIKSVCNCMFSCIINKKIKESNNKNLKFKEVLK